MILDSTANKELTCEYESQLCRRGLFMNGYVDNLTNLSPKLLERAHAGTWEGAASGHVARRYFTVKCWTTLIHVSYDITYTR